MVEDPLDHMEGLQETPGQEVVNNPKYNCNSPAHVTDRLCRIDNLLQVGCQALQCQFFYLNVERRVTYSALLPVPRILPGRAGAH